jgi:nitroimidazol reductase NimA-like FMN-containing flavoprotein (pyridoxamine 5'-phosphate oxidase superfamily)
MVQAKKNSNYIKVETKRKKYEIQRRIKKILQSQLYGILATSYRNQPYTSLLAFIASEDLNNIYVATSKNTHKFENVNENENVAFFIDTRSNDNFDVSNAYALTIFGKAEIIDKDKITQIKKLYVSRHPQLDSFIHSKNVEILQINISSFSFVERFKNVYLLKMNEEENNTIT